MDGNTRCLRARGVRGRVRMQLVMASALVYRSGDRRVLVMVRYTRGVLLALLCRTVARRVVGTGDHIVLFVIGGDARARRPYPYAMAVEARASKWLRRFFGRVHRSGAHGSVGRL